MLFLAMFAMIENPPMLEVGFLLEVVSESLLPIELGVLGTESPELSVI